MGRDPRYDILFEPVKIGPVTAKNRFFQVPHCNGMGRRYPMSMAMMRAIKAEGGWAVVSTEETEIHYSAELSPFLEGRLWDDTDIPILSKMTEAVHRHGGLAAIELVYGGLHAPNLYSREIPLAPSHVIVTSNHPIQARAMDKGDIANVRRWYRKAALRAKRAGFDIVYVYAGHDMSLLMHFLVKRYNHRVDEYGGNLTNRTRLLREVIDDTRDAVGDTCGIALRLAVDELLGRDGLTAENEGHEIVGSLANLPDLWDVNISGWANDSATARFSDEGYQEPYIAFVKKLTEKPVVGVGRYTSPDSMVRVIRQGIMDMIGAARPSIADPFLPKKIEEGRIDDIRECIGCNICVTGDSTSTPIRCTQNPTMGEEWRRGWHPERIQPATSKERVLVVGGGPAGLEAAQALGKRGYEVAIAEARDELGGRIVQECKLPGLATWARVRDWRLGQITKLSNVSTYPASQMKIDDVLEFGAQHVVIATGSFWRRDGVGRALRHPPPWILNGPIATPNDLMEHSAKFDHSDGPVIVFDDDHYYMGGVLAEFIKRRGRQVALVTPAAEASAWTRNLMEHDKIQTRLLEIGVSIHPHRVIAGRTKDTIDLACVFTGRKETIGCGLLVVVTSRLPNDDLYLALQTSKDRWTSAGLKSSTRVGDALAPGTIAAAVYSGHRFARELGSSIDIDAVPFRRESIGLSDLWDAAVINESH